MHLALTCTPSETLTLTVNGQLAAEIAVGQPLLRDTLEAEVRAARACHALVRMVDQLLGDHVTRLATLPEPKTTPEKNEAAFLRGLRDGYAGKTKPYPMAGVAAPIPLESGRAYSLGYQDGETLARCGRVASEGNTAKTETDE